MGIVDLDPAPGALTGPSVGVLMDALAVVDKARASAEAFEIATLALIVDRVLAAEPSSAVQEMQLRSVAAELGAARRVHDRTVMRRMSEAWTVQHRFASCLEALAEGEISKAHLDVIVAAGNALDDDARLAFENVALNRAKQESPNRLKEILKTVAQEFTATTFAERHQVARQDRKVRVEDCEDGMSELFAYIPTLLAHGIYDALTGAARRVAKARKRAKRELVDLELSSAQVPGGLGLLPESSIFADRDGSAVMADAVRVQATDDRTFDQIRADALCELVLAGGPLQYGDAEDAITAHVQITIPVLTLIEGSNEPALLAGAGPIDAATARRIAGASSGWDRVMTQPIDGHVVAVDRYRPSAEQRRMLRVRDEHCRFAGCRGKVWFGDMDHSHDYALGGETSTDNLANLCRYHHTMKHATGWKVVHQGDGVIEWTTPRGKTYTDTPISTLRFVATEDLSPGAPLPRCQRDLAVLRSHDSVAHANARTGTRPTPTVVAPPSRVRPSVAPPF